MNATDATELLAAWGYPAFVGSLAATGFGFPIPEDLLLLAGGYLISVGIFEWPAAWVLGVAGLMASDGFLYAAGRRLRHGSIEGTKLARLLRPERIRTATAWFDRLGSPAIFAARFVPGSRAIVFVTAGLRDVPPGRFVALDAVASVLWVPIVLAIGSALGDRIGDLERALEYATWAVMLAVIVGILLFLVWRRWGREESKL